ncbi:MAG: Tn3 family transposase [Nitrospirae bacterium]|nr:Tn3 family transposase [Nitrospirota bacterium]
MKDINSAKRYTLLLSLVHRARVQTRDDLATMFIKRMATLHKKGKEALADIQVKHREKTENLVAVFSDVLQILEEGASDADAGRQIRNIVEPRGGVTSLLDDCNAVTAYSGNNYLPLLWKYYRSHRKALFQLVRALTLDSTSQDRSLIKAVSVLIEHENSRGDFITVPVDLSFSEERWISLLKGGENSLSINRRLFEICVFSHLAAELKSGDICVEGSNAYADHRKQMLTWKECEPMVADYCRELKLPETASGFVATLKAWLTEKAEEVDKGYPDNRHVVIDEKGEPVLKRYSAKEQSQKGKELEAIVIERLKERNLLDILCNVEHWVNWTRHFGPLSGSDPKLKNPVERYILTSFAYGCNLGPNQAARPMRGDVTPHVLSFTNRRHISATKLDGALKDIINQYNRFDLPKHWGSGKRAGADGTQYDLYEQNLISEYHIRYGSSGGIAYHHISDTYIALFSHFIPCGVWEAVYIIEGLLKNKSDIQPDTLHADTQGQSEPVFGLSYLLGIDLMPRIRNWKELTGN